MKSKHHFLLYIPSWESIDSLPQHIEYYEKLKNLDIQHKEDKFVEKKGKSKTNKKTYKKKRYYKKTK